MAMKRTQVYLTQNEHKALTALSKKTKKKRSEIIREAIDAHLEKQQKKKTRAEILDEVAGTWKDNDFDFEGLRKSWNSRIEDLG
ncbi:CopG family transcriptional regulator [Turneriella parva]|uniref:CopG-like domain-containing protein DNA-binding n=1 Tax=Turneriella parva (strain ATCC BAA-1111 / DSM 21527 / NCTC 11395 / H) TaxID=869212 RepID=I4BAE0_TURPD|nr:CopG family transcriptional regulator [Turneriella parva]AFM14247.1 CopG-like domain-containing protein DNA-binding [Turneriella parva DSM 21527]